MKRILRRLVGKQEAAVPATNVAHLIEVAGFNSIGATLRVDNSSSVFSGKLDGAMVSAVEAIEQGLALNSKNRVARGTFCAELVDLDLVPGQRKKIRFLHPHDPQYPAFRSLYKRGWGTHLDVAVHTELRRLIARWNSPARPQKQRQLALLITDGFFTPGGDVGGEDKHEAIQKLMKEVLQIAASFGGPTKSPIAMFYCGIGQDRQAHLHLATGRYGFPPEWVLTRLNTAEDIVDAGNELSQSIQRMDRGEGTHTCFGWDDDEEDNDYGQTQFGFGADND